MKQFLLIATLLMLFACVQQAEETPAEQVAEEILEQENTTEEPAEEPEPAREPEPTEAEPNATADNETAEETTAADVLETTEPAQLRTKMYQFLDTFRERVNSYEFTNNDNHYFVKGPKYKIILNSPVATRDEQFSNRGSTLFYYDTVYLDRNTKTAIAYCEGHHRETSKQCTDLDLFDIPYPVNYANYSIALPEDWLLTYLDDEPARIERNKYYVNGRATISVTLDRQPTVQLHFDELAGLPIRADTLVDGQLTKRRDFENLVINDVRDVDVRHRSKSEIPSEEAFYT